MEPQNFRDALLRHYDHARRALPWRETRDPYAILVSELMLQQTQVKTVIPYYLRFLERFPTPLALAGADEETLLKMWQGLGYYRRARNLQAAAQQIVGEHGGVFPRDKSAIDALKGVGPYTSAAVASIAFEMAHACVDGNVIRVISRLFALDGDTGAVQVRKVIAGRAQALLCPERPGDFNQAMMELGATVCTPRNPGCLTCPVRSFCRTQKRGDDPHLRPFKAKKVRVSKITYSSLFLFDDQHLLLARRHEKGLMGGMWELPAQVLEKHMDWRPLLAAPATLLGRLKPINHRFTHLHAQYVVEVLQGSPFARFLKPPDGYAEVRALTFDEVAHLPQTKVLTGLLPQLHRIMQGDRPCQASPSVLPGTPVTP